MKRANDSSKKPKNESTSSSATPKSSTCVYCNDQPYSLDHLKSCVPYLNSNRYKRLIVERSQQNNNKQVIPIHFADITESSNIFDLYSDLDRDIQEIFEEEIFTHLDFNRIQYHQSFSTKNYKNHLNKNQSVLFSKINNDHIVCYNVSDLTEDEVQNLSPYSPLIMVNNEKLIAMLDTGSQVSLINKNYEFEDQNIFNNLLPTKITFSFIDKNVVANRTGKTQPLEVKYRGRTPFNHSFEVVDMPIKKLPILIGRDLIPKLGISIDNIAYSFEDQEKIVYEDTVNHEQYIPNVSKACSDEEYEQFMQALEPYLEDNKNINIHNLCPLKEAVVYLDTPPDKVVKIRQYPIAFALQPVVREQIKKMGR